VLHPEPVGNDNALPSAPPPRRARVRFCPHPGQVRHLKSWLTKYFTDRVDIFHMYAEMRNDERTKMQLKFLDLRNPSVFIPTPKVCRTGLHCKAVNHAVIIEKFWVVNEQQQAFEWVVWLWQNWVPHTWLLSTGFGGYDNLMRKHCGVVGMRVLHSWMSWPNSMTLMIYRNLESCTDHIKLLQENGDPVQSDELSSSVVRTLHQGMPV